MPPRRREMDGVDADMLNVRAGVIGWALQDASASPSQDMQLSDVEAYVRRKTGRSKRQLRRAREVTRIIEGVARCTPHNDMQNPASPRYRSFIEMGVKGKLSSAASFKKWLTGERAFISKNKPPPPTMGETRRRLGIGAPPKPRPTAPPPAAPPKPSPAPPPKPAPRQRPTAPRQRPTPPTKRGTMLREVLTPMPGELVLVQTRAPARGKTDGVKNIKETWRLARMVGSRTAAAIGSTWKRELGRETVRRRFVGTHRAYALSAPLAAMPDAELKKLKTVFTGDLDVGRMSALTKGGASLPAK